MMDSIFEQPRTTPKPTPVTQSVKAPVVPEASLIFQNPSRDTRKLPQNIPPHQQSYNAWKLQNVPQVSQDSFVNTREEKENKQFQNPYQFYKTPCDTSTNKSMLKKQVRFERPHAPICSPNFHALLGKPKIDKAAEYVAPLTNYKQPLQNKNDPNDSLGNIPDKMKFKTHISRYNDVPVSTKNSDVMYTSPSENTCKYTTESNPQYNKQFQKTTTDSPKYDRKKQSSPLLHKYTSKYPEIAKYGTNNKLDLSIYDQRPMDRCTENLFEKTTLNSEGIKKFALPDHIQQKEKLKSLQNYNMRQIAQNLPTIDQNLSGRIPNYPSRSQNLPNMPQNLTQNIHMPNDTPNFTQNTPNLIQNTSSNQNVIQNASNASQGAYLIQNAPTGTQNFPQQSYNYTQTNPNKPNSYQNGPTQNPGAYITQNNMQKAPDFVQNTPQNIPNVGQNTPIVQKTRSPAQNRCNGSQTVVNGAQNTYNTVQNEFNRDNSTQSGSNLGQNYVQVVSNDQNEPLVQISDCDRKILPQTEQLQACQMIFTNKDKTNEQNHQEIPETTKNTDKCSCNCKLDKKENHKTDPRIAELLNIVQVQNEQIVSLQEQVQMVIKLCEKQRKTNIDETMEKMLKASKITEYLEKPQKELPKNKVLMPKNREQKVCKRENLKKNILIYKDEQVGTSYNDGICRRITKENIVTKDSKTEKISVGIMTSFQVSLNKSPFDNAKPQKKEYLPYKESNPPYSNSSQYDSNDSSSSEDYDYRERFKERWSERANDCSDTLRDDNDYSLNEIGLEEEVQVQEPPLSPDNTVHVDMQDYESDSDDEDSSVEPGWTFYDNILGKVNNILENSPSPLRKEKPRTRRNPQERKITDHTMEEIKQATIQKLQKKGIKEEDFADLNPKEVSFAVKQLLMKYMSDEELANIVQKQDKLEPKEEGHRFRQEQRNPVHHRGRSHKMTSNQQKMKSSLKHRPTSNSNGAKILDITTLKKQPKLL